MYPLPKSAFADELYARGRALAEAGLRLQHIVWDADEVLWDWALDGRRAAFGIPKMLFKREYGHREWIRLKPGVWELIWGIKDVQDELGDPGLMRISTNGYAWRLFRFAQDIPGFAELIGEPADANVYRGWNGHPRMFFRKDYVRCMQELFAADAEGRVDSTVADMNGAADLVRNHFKDTPFETSLKLPELAQLLGKPGFDDAFILVDDSGRNVKRFAASGRIGIKASVPAKHSSKIPPNVAFQSPKAHVKTLSNNVAIALADQFEVALEKRGESAFLNAESSDTVPSDYIATEFVVDIPSERIGGEWFQPVQRLKDAWKPTRT